MALVVRKMFTRRMGDGMLPYGKVRALQEQRAARLVSERGKATRGKSRRDRSAGLAELLNGLAQGLVSIGIPGGPGKRRPAGPAY